MKGLMFLPFVALTFLCWGLYAPALHVGQAAFGAEGTLSAFRPFICVGLAYFIIAAAVPMVVLRTKGEAGFWSVKGFVWSFVAGGIGALGALGIILSLKWGGRPVYVMPLVFGCAPVVNTFVTMMFSRSFKQATLTFYLGILVVVIGAVGVLVFKPAPPKVHAAVDVNVPVVLTHVGAPASSIKIHYDGSGESSLGSDPASPRSAAGKDSSDQNDAKKVEDPNTSVANMILRGLCILATVLCWGAYGPVLHKGQTVMGGSRLRPFICVGLAYCAIAVALPFMIMPAFPTEPGTWWTFVGFSWSLLAGALGAFGALGIIYAFNFGGKPITVMPLVFGCAPVINTITATTQNGTWDQISYTFVASLFLVIAGAVTVLLTAPKSGPPAKVATKATDDPSEDKTS